MKCVCGYEQGMAWVQPPDLDEPEEYIEVNSDGEKFKRIKGHYVVEGAEPWDGCPQVQLYGCPECGTIQMVVD